MMKSLLECKVWVHNKQLTHLDITNSEWYYCIIDLNKVTYARLASDDESEEDYGLTVCQIDGTDFTLDIEYVDFVEILKSFGRVYERQS